MSLASNLFIYRPCWQGEFSAQAKRWGLSGVTNWQMVKGETARVQRSRFMRLATDYVSHLLLLLTMGPSSTDSISTTFSPSAWICKLGKLKQCTSCPINDDLAFRLNTCTDIASVWENAREMSVLTLSDKCYTMNSLNEMQQEKKTLLLGKATANKKMCLALAYAYWFKLSCFTVFKSPGVQIFFLQFFLSFFWIHR